MGASTITMQLARLRWGLYTRNIPGKIAQSFCALYLEICLSKQEILAAYLNLAPLGGNIEGYGAASWYYFNKDPKELTKGEIFTLAVIPQNPNSRAPLGQANSRSIPVELTEARLTLYESWLVVHPEDALLRPEMDMPPYLVNRFPRETIHLTEYLNTLNPDDGVGRSITTTVNRRFQSIVERELESHLVRNRNWGIRNGSILLLDWTTMEVLAAVGSANYADDDIQGQVNGFASKRSPGSTLKPFVYALALEQGIIHPEKMLKDTPQGFSEYTPDNYQGEFKGPVKAWFALVDSRNIPAVQLAGSIRDPDLHEFLKNAGVTGLKENSHYGLSVVLGTADLTMLELVSLYAGLANEGILQQPRFVANSNTVNSNAASPRRVLSPQAAAITLRMLERNPAPDDTRYGAGRILPVAYKTGTSIGFKDAWSIAVFDRYVLAVWLGNFSGEGNNALIGRLVSTPLQFSIIDAIIAETPAALPERPMPQGVSMVPVCAVSGDIPNEDCPQTLDTWFIPGISPINRCRIHRRVFIDTRTGYRTDDIGNDETGPHIRSEVREFWPTDLLEIFAQAGLPRFMPPPYPPKDRPAQSNGFPPSILSPLSNTTYVLRPQDDRRNRIVLLANADQDSGELFWFANTLFLGRAGPTERFLWQPGPGLWDIAVVDSQGRSASLRLTVEMAPQ
jgi:penicillin-binding protein 1C